MVAIGIAAVVLGALVRWKKLSVANVYDYFEIENNVVEEGDAVVDDKCSEEGGGSKDLARWKVWASEKKRTSERSSLMMNKKAAAVKGENVRLVENKYTGLVKNGGRTTASYGAVDQWDSVRCSFLFWNGFVTRGCHWIPRLLGLKLLHAWDSMACLVGVHSLTG